MPSLPTPASGAPRAVHRFSPWWAAALGLCLWAGGAAAQTAPVTAPAPAGNAAAGKTIADSGLAPAVAACASCHGAKGEGAGAGAFPPLAGSGADYLRSQLDAFADGSRANPVMAPMAKAMQPQDRANVAAYFASLPSGIAPPVLQPPADPKNTGAWLVQRGRMADGIPACASCHGPNGGGVGPHFPAIAKLSAAYMQAQVDAWKGGSRGPGPLGLMPAIAKKLTAQDIEAVAQYYASQGGK